jgi:hypothetical protein
VLLGQLIEQVSGGSYADFVRKNIFEPLGMKDSGYDWNETVVPRHASGYAPDKKGLVNAGFINMSIPHAAGALYSTTGDLLRWQRGLYEGKLLTPASLQAMTTPYLSDYGYGLAVRDATSGKSVGHGGGIEGFSTEVRYRFNDKVSVIVLSNVEGSRLVALVENLATVAGGSVVVLPLERKEIALTPVQKTALVGTYAMPQGPRFRVREHGGQLTARLDGQRAIPFFAESFDQLFYRKVDAQLEVHRNAAGAVEALTLVQNGRRIRMARVADVAPDYDAVALYLRGDMNEWGTRDSMRKEADGSYVARIALTPGHYGFKVGSEDFKAIDLGGIDDDQVAALGVAQSVDSVGPNLSVDIAAPGTYVFTLSTKDKQNPTLNVAKAP